MQYFNINFILNFSYLTREIFMQYNYSISQYHFNFIPYIVYNNFIDKSFSVDKIFVIRCKL